MCDYIHPLSVDPSVADCLSAGGEVGVIPVRTGYPVSGRYWQDVKDKEYQYFSTNGAHC